MDLGRAVLLFFSALGAFNGLILGLYFIFFARKKKLSNYFLGVLMLALSVRIGKSVLYYFDSGLLQIYLQIGLSACWFIGPFLFYYIKAEKDQVKKVPLNWVWILSSMLAIIVALGIILPYQRYPFVWNAYVVKLIYAQWGACLILSAVELRDVIKKVGIPGQLKAVDKWLLAIFLINVVIFTCYLWALLGHSSGAYISGGISFSFVVYVLIMVLLHRQKNDGLFSAETKYGNKKLADDDAALMLKRLERVMNEKTVFKNSNLKLNDLANEIYASPHQLSQLLNDNLGKGFTLFVNEYRIEAACKILSENGRLTIESISEEVGFNSKSTFFATFKRLKGVTPAMYQQRILKA